MQIKQTFDSFHFRSVIIVHLKRVERAQHEEQSQDFEAEPVFEVILGKWFVCECIYAATGTESKTNFLWDNKVYLI